MSFTQNLAVTKIKQLMLCLHTPQKWCRARPYYPSVCVAKHWLIGRYGKWQNPDGTQF